MKNNSAPSREGKIKRVIIAALLVMLVDIASVVIATCFFLHCFPELLHVGDKLNQIGIDALIRMERDTVLFMVPAFSMMLISNLGLMFLLLMELKLNTDKRKQVRAGDII